MSGRRDDDQTEHDNHDSINFSRPRRGESLIPPVPPLPGSLKVSHVNGYGRGRESFVDSANMAEGIFDLYGQNRDSWQSARSAYDDADETPKESARHPGNGAMRNASSSSLHSRPRPPSPAPDPDREEVLYEPQGDREVMEDPPDSPASWEGVFSMLSTTDHGPNRDSHLLSQGQHNGSGPSTPPITLTPDKSDLHMKPPYKGRESTLTTSTSTSASVTPSSSRGQPGMSRLAPLNKSTGSGISAGTASGNTSVVSIGSSQYPGEENESFYVRSTYARLDAEGVHGDGWDPGIERTRGGPNAAKRNTVALPSKGGDVDPQERDFLSSLDRYGFVNEPLRNRSETRLALIPTAPLLKVPKLPIKSPIPPGSKVEPPPPNYGPSSDDGPSARPPPSPMPESDEGRKHRRKEEERVDKWMRMMTVKRRDEGGNVQEWGWRDDGQSSKLQKRVYKGIPDRWRMAAWWTLAEDNARNWKGKGKASAPAEQLARAYTHSIDLPSIHDVQIDLDVPRTISGHTLFVTRYGSGQRSLFHVLHVFSLLCDTCGYCQGMGPIAATLLCYFDPERVYALLVRLHDVYGMHSIFAPGFPGLLEAFYVQERLMEYLMPEVYKSFQRNMISSSAWGTKWYITLFVNTVPFSQQLRIWDALMMDGRDVIVIVSVAILWAFKDLLADPRANFESILSLLSSYFVAEDEDALMRWIRKFIHQPGVKSKMDAWREEWARLVAEGKDRDALL